MIWALLAFILPPTEYLCFHLNWEKRSSVGEGIAASISEKWVVKGQVSDRPGPPTCPPAVHSMVPGDKPWESLEQMAPVMQPPTPYSLPVPPVTTSPRVCEPLPRSSLDLAFGLQISGIHPTILPLGYPLSQRREFSLQHQFYRIQPNAGWLIGAILPIPREGFLTQHIQWITAGVSSNF